MVAEATSAKFIKLHSQGKIVKSESILDLMAQLEEALGGTRDILVKREAIPTIPFSHVDQIECVSK
jgi:hypothetical protein